MSPNYRSKKFLSASNIRSVLIMLVGAGFYYIYVVLPEKVAEQIVAKSQVRQPLTETPQDYDIKNYQDVSFPTSDGVTLSGWWVPAPSRAKSQGTILLTHGVFKNRQQVLSRAVFFHKLGYQVLLFDLRGEGQSGPSPISGGLLEAKDFVGAEQYLEGRKEIKKPLVYFGFSLGAITALRAAEAAPPDAVIADSPLANIKSYVSRRTIGGTFSSLPGFLGNCLKDYDRLTGLDLQEKDLDLMPVVEKLGQTPVLYITGQSDDLALSTEVQQLFQHTPNPHRQLVYMPDSGHEETYKKYPMIYEKLVKDFLADLHNGFPTSDDLLKKKESPAAPAK